MLKKKYKLPATMAIVCTIAFTGFKDTGIFVKDFVGVKQNGEQHQFNREEDVEILKETEQMYIVHNSGHEIEVPKELLVVKEGQQPAAEGEMEGTARVSKVLKSGNNIFTLIKGESVHIKEVRDGKYIILDHNGVEYEAKPSEVESRGKAGASRGAVSKRATSVSKIVSGAYGALGVPYVSGGTSSNGYDCSGLTYSLYLNQLGIKLPRSSSDQVSAGETVAKSELIPGDLLFFRTSGSGIGHVGVYIGDNKMIHASTGQRKIIVADIDSNYFATRYVTAKRIIN